MSSEEKMRRASIFKKMALRDKLDAFRKRQSLNALRDELNKNNDVRNKLENLVEETNSQKLAKTAMESVALQDDLAKTAMALHSSSWYNTQVRDQLEIAENRCVHLEKEMQSMQSDLVRAEQKRARKQERADELVSQAKKLELDKADERLTELRRRSIKH